MYRFTLLDFKMDEVTSTTKRPGKSRWTRSRTTAKDIVSYLEVNPQDPVCLNLPLIQSDIQVDKFKIY